ncbi:MAG: restriction endonuclease subunit M/S [Sphingobacteriales bacterium]|nr:MAG: restriction endonuclease subunit M/S [Sphingobacteriales bacterium]
MEKLNTNPNIPELFRNIFKNAYLPYRDPSTLKLFLKHINEFEYSHSEKLGDAFEYLLSVMGSQGDAGQFRTPRHIIDFVTACVNPQKNETVLDPACGTAGFLLSAYKHILNQNTDKRQGDKLKPDDRKKLATNFVGYDISPDMVRLSLANMYLHGFATPLIHEYDSLSSEDRWQETFDVILANPPFMTPKGGIRPHKKFGVQANKAEVLFTDYIAEHLNSNGRAGIVVPNGIVATSQTAYKQLRKMMVQDSLIAVISLPAGVFQPYSGVKTSVLILDKRLAKKSQHILFLKIENDGFDLGAQRREIDKNDLPLALQTLVAYKSVLGFVGLEDDRIEEKMIDSITQKVKSFNPEIKEIQIQTIATLVEKETVLGNKDIVLSAERYFEKQARSEKWNTYRLDEICSLITDGVHLSPQYESTGIPMLDSKNIRELLIDDTCPTKFISKETDLKLSQRCKPNANDVLLSSRGTIGNPAIVREGQNFNIMGNIILLRGNTEMIIPKFLLYYINNSRTYIESIATGSSQKGLYLNQVRELEIPLPPLEIQQQIVAEIENYQKIIDGAKQVVNNYKPTITINPDWEMVELGEVCKPEYGFTETAKEKGNARFIRITDIGSDGKLKDTDPKYVELTKEAKQSLVVKDDILVARTGATYGKTMIFDEDYPAVFASFLIRLNFDKTKIYPKYYWAFAQSENYIQQAARLMTGGGQPQFNGNAIVKIQIPIPPIEEQQTIVKAIEEEMKLVNANKHLIEIFEQKIKTKIGEVWGVKVEVETV